LDTHKLDELASKLADALPSDLQHLRSDLEANFKTLLAGRLDKLDLVTREEFDVQRKVLARTRARLEQLETELSALQNQAGDRD